MTTRTLAAATEVQRLHIQYVEVDYLKCASTNATVLAFMYTITKIQGGTK